MHCLRLRRDTSTHRCCRGVSLVVRALVFVLRGSHLSCQSQPSSPAPELPSKKQSCLHASLLSPGMPVAKRASRRCQAGRRTRDRRSRSCRRRRCPCRRCTGRCRWGACRRRCRLPPSCPRRRSCCHRSPCASTCAGPLPPAPVALPPVPVALPPEPVTPPPELPAPPLMLPPLPVAPALPAGPPAPAAPAELPPVPPEPPAGDVEPHAAASNSAEVSANERVRERRSRIGWSPCGRDGQGQVLRNQGAAAAGHAAGAFGAQRGIDAVLPARHVAGRAGVGRAAVGHAAVVGVQSAGMVGLPTQTSQRPHGTMHWVTCVHGGHLAGLPKSAAVHVGTSRIGVVARRDRAAAEAVAAVRHQLAAAVDALIRLRRRQRTLGRVRLSRRRRRTDSRRCWSSDRT